MFETIAPFLAYAGALAVAAAIPGPGVAAVVGRSLGSDARGALPFVVGLALGDVIFLTVAVLGLSVLAATFAGVFTAVKVAGGLYLIYLAWRFWTAGVDPTRVERERAQSAWMAGLSGLAVTLGNPKTVVFYLALLPNVIDLASVTVLDWLVLSVLTLAVLFAVMLPYSVAAARLRALFASAVALRRLNRGAALFIGGAGALILADAARTR